MYEKRMKEIADRKLEIRAMLEGNEEGLDLDSIQAELRTLETEEKTLRDRAAVIERLKAVEPAKEPELRTVDKTGTEPAKQPRVDLEKRGRDLMEMRTVTVGASSVVMPKHYASDIKSTFNEVSSLIDRINVKPLPGGESFTQPYLVGYGTGDYKTENNDYASAEPTFGYAEIGKAKVTAYAEDSEEVLKLPAADYDSIVMQGIPTALRKKITKEILIGDGTTNHLVGIFDDGATAIDAATDVTLTEIDETTLDEIIYSFGGDEDVEDVAVLVLNKLDLKEFAMLRDADGRKIYDVKNNGNTGTIDGVPYIINSACYAVTAAATTPGQYCMAYGPLSNYTLAVFSDVDVQRSTDYKFKSGMIAHRGSVFVGGNVCARNGFLRVKKG